MFWFGREITMQKHKHEHSQSTRRSLENPREALIGAGLENGKTLLDLGTGSGYLALTAAEIMGKESKVYALDAHEESIKALSKEILDNDIRNVYAIKADAVKEIPLQKNMVDICLMSNVVHGFEANNEMDSVMKNINRVLVEEGKLIIIDFKKMDTGFGPPLDIRLNPDEVEDLVSPYGYILTSSFDAGQTHYGLVFKKTSLQDKFC
jgi:ubiquinone/menaquinone biosynthesis C-methylase UbiE